MRGYAGKCLEIDLETEKIKTVSFEDEVINAAIPVNRYL